MILKHQFKPTLPWCLALILKCLCLALLPSISALGQIPCRYEIETTIQGPLCGGFPGVTQGAAINSRGHVTGSFGNGVDCVTRPFIWKPETGVQVLTLPPWLLEAYAWDINDNGWICGTGLGPVTGQVGWVRTDAGVWIELQSLSPPLGWCSAVAINNSNTVCGYRASGPGQTPRQAYTWNPITGYMNLGSIVGTNSSATNINDDGTVVGWTGPGDTFGARAFIISKNNATILPPMADNISTIAHATNGTLVVGHGHVLVPGLPTVGFVYDLQTSVMTSIPPPDKGQSLCHRVTSDGVVFLGISLGSWKPYVWRDGQLAQMEINPTPTGPTSAPVDVNAAGKLIIVAGISQSTLVLKPLPPALGDIDADCRVDMDDLLEVIADWHETESPADLNHDRIVNVQDLLIVIWNWTFD